AASRGGAEVASSSDMHFVASTSPRTFFLVLDRGEEFVGTLRQFAEQQRIRGGRFAALGAFEKCTVGWWSWTEKDYEKRDIDEQVEVLSVIGDISVERGKTRIHAHATLGRRDGIDVGGHLF